MERKAYKLLVEWKNKKNRKPLILDGVRQVGKTWLIQEFGKNEYENVAYINCDNNPLVANLFSDFDMERILLNISAISEQEIKEEKTLIVLDEIQELPLGITALKYFCEQKPNYHIIVSGSLLGIKIHQGTGYPVGKVDKITLYPLSFNEFLLANNKKQLLSIIESNDKNKYYQLNSFRDELKNQLKQYFYVGGMPEVVQNYIDNKNLKTVREIQLSLLEGYRLDISKHAPKNLLAKINLVLNSVGSQLTKENKKFVFGLLKEGARAKEYEDAIQWLIDCGLVYKNNRLEVIKKPITFYEDIKAFKLYVCDLGLLGAICNTNAKDVLVLDNAFSEYKGAFCEQYVYQQMITSGLKPYYYTNDNSTNEIDFVVETDNIYLIEVKSGGISKAKSLKTALKDNPDYKGLRFSLLDYIEQENIINVYLPLVNQYVSEINKNY